MLEFKLTIGLLGIPIILVRITDNMFENNLGEREMSSLIFKSGIIGVVHDLSLNRSWLTLEQRYTFL